LPLQGDHLKEKKSPKFKSSIKYFISCGFIVIVLSVSLLSYLIINKIVFPIFLEKEKNQVESVGNSIVLELRNKIKNAETLALSISNLYNFLEKKDNVFMTTIPAMLNIKGYENIIAGGGVWPEPYTFNPKKKLNSFFFGRDNNGNLKFYDDYNSPIGKGYLREEWYVPVKFVDNTKVYWSRSYIDPYSKQPMVTCSAPIKKNGTFSGVATVDLKLEGLKKIFNYYGKKVKGYIFVVDRDNNFLYFPDESKIMTRKDTRKKYINASLLSEKYREFTPIYNSLKKSDEKIISLAKKYNISFDKITEKLSKLSYDIDKKQAKIITAVLTNPFQFDSHLSTKLASLTLKKDLIFNEPSTCTIFYMPRTYWKIGVIVPEKQVFLLVHNIIFKVIVYLILGLVLILLIGYRFLSKILLTPLEEITNDLENRDNIDYKSNNELGKLAYYFNKRSNELKESEEYAKAIFEQSPIPIIIFDKDGIMTDNNLAWEKFWKVDPSKSIGKYNIFKDKILKNSGEFNTIKDVFKGKSCIITNLRYTVSITGKKGEDKILNVIMFPIKNSFNEILRVVAMQQDLTEKIKIEEELKRIGKLESLGHLSAGIAHDFNNILTSISLNLEMLEMKITVKDEKTAKFINNIKISLESASKLINKIKMVSRKETFNMATVNLKNIVEEAVNIVKPALKFETEIKTIYHGYDFFIKGDKNSLIQLIMNLLINAKDAIEEGGVVSGIIEISLKNEKNSIIMEIRDNGSGIPEATIDKIFEPFFTTKHKDANRGTGLGLSIVYNIVKSHNGIINVKSSIGKETVFTIKFPKTENIALEQKEKTKNINLKKQLLNKTVLLIEDEENIIDIEALFLESLGLKVIKALNGEEAVKILQKENLKIDLVFVDWEMPVMNGEKTIEKIKEINANLPIFIVSGAINEKISDMKIKGAVVNIIKKPFNKDKIIEKLNQTANF
jgi:PAS domain S-box-containing protein